MMYATLTAQAAVIAVMLLLSGPASLVEETRRDLQQGIERRVAAEPARLRCRLYFGCVQN
jgi:hypothetical protein